MLLLYIVIDAGWSSLVARRAHNPKVVGSNPAPATKSFYFIKALQGPFCYLEGMQNLRGENVTR